MDNIISDPSSDHFELACARIEYCLDLLRKYPCRQWLKRVLVILCAEFLDLLPALSDRQQAAVAEVVAFFVIDAIIEQPEKEKFGKDLETMTEVMKSKGTVNADVVERIKKQYQESGDRSQDKIEE